MQGKRETDDLVSPSDLAPGKWREGTIFTQYSLSSALVCPPFHSLSLLHGLKTHTCSQPLTTCHASVIC